MIKTNTVIIVILLITFIIILSILLFKKKWKCIEGKCELVIGGDCDTKDKCLAKCKIIHEKLK